ncbi:hypothetical protein EDD27_3605 [Nonomuraea polychroma]|uniref:Uncharacterized protein n=1 Tax=Nonomuraea polychroma TaxID=46176 RepID=A0A438M5K6_9ACTN|nr:hypothetical protein [Nonomuraea polychroma]RVX41136.1 hypothetical protein EDD27_3605 [Nonomuraea polychroma]
MPSAKATARDQAKGCGCLIVAMLLVVGGCNALFGSDDAPTPVPVVATATPTTAPAITWSPELIADLDDDGIEDRYDVDADGDGVTRTYDRDDEDPNKGKRKPKRTTTPKPAVQPKREQPAPVAKAHPGGFCGTPVAVGIASNGRTYTCRGGHWRR